VYSESVCLQFFPISIQHLSYQLVDAVEQAYGSVLLYFLSLLHFGQQSNDPIIQPAHIQPTLMEFIKDIHYISCNNIPTPLKEFNRDLIWACSLFFSIWNNAPFTPSSEKV
jgi:hypothetical protein